MENVYGKFLMLPLIKLATRLIKEALKFFKTKKTIPHFLYTHFQTSYFTRIEISRAFLRAKQVGEKPGQFQNTAKTVVFRVVVR